MATQIPSNFAQMNLDIFLGKDPGRVLWQPRLEFWYTVNKTRGTLPERLKDASLFDLYDYCHASVRYFTWPLHVRYKNVQVTEKWLDEKHRQVAWETPLGALTETVHYDEWNLSAYNSEYRLKGPQDFPIWEYILQDEEWTWDQESYERDLVFIGGRGAPQFFFRRSPVQGLFIENMGFEKAIFLLQDQPQTVERYIEFSTENDDKIYDVLCQCPVTILNFGENIDAHMDPPTIWRKYHLPYYTKRNEQLHAAGKRTHIHIDGAMKPLIKAIRASPFDGIEACTPLPQGDVTIEEMKAALGDKVLLDGIPAVYFLPYFPVKELLDCTKKIIDLFHPRLVLGISDEIPPDGDIERVRMIGEMVQET